MEECGWTYTKVNRCLAEGRASLARHVAEIESGVECEQYLPLLSRLLDGEASRKELRPLRAHLKTCPGCRAQLRSLHQRGDTLGIVLPAGVLAGSAATDATADVPGLITRLYETLATTIHDRAALSAIKLQAAVEATSTGKLAAVAASAAAVASGGAVAVTEVPNRLSWPTQASEHRALTPSKPAAVPTSTIRPAAPSPAARRPLHGGAGQASRTKKPGLVPSRPKRRSSVSREFGSARATVESPPSGARTADAVAVAREFGSGAPTPVPAPAAAPASAQSTRAGIGPSSRTSSVSAAAREFSP